MSQLDKTPRDPRIKRTRAHLQNAFCTLMENRPFESISITDICKEAEIARVTFYQHYDSKEALLLACVSDFFAGLYQSVDQSALDQYFETGEIGAFLSTQQMGLTDPSQVRLVGVALQQIGSAVRKLTIQSFLSTFSQRETEFGEKELEVLATFYVGGVLTLLEQFLSGEMSVSPAEFQLTTLSLLRLLRQGAIESQIFPDVS